jgi:hypothetical protein
MAIANGLMSEDDYLLSEILFNPNSPAQLDRIQEQLSILADIVRRRDSDAMAEYLARVRRNLE